MEHLATSIVLNCTTSTEGNFYPSRFRGRADLGFYKGGCPIHLKGAPKWVEASPRKFKNLDTLRCIFTAFQGIYKLYD